MKIPLLNNQVDSPNVPDLANGPSIAQAGAEWEAVAQIGNVSANIGMNLLKKRKDAETKAFALSSRGKLKNETLQFQDQLKAKYGDKDPSGYAKEMEDFFDRRGKELLDESPTDDARDLFSSQFEELKGEYQARFYSEENKNKAIYQKNLLNQASVSDRELLIKSPDSAKASELYADRFEAIKAGTGIWWDQEEANEKIKTEAKLYGTSYLEGAIQNKRYADVIRFADGKDNLAQHLYSQMDPSVLQAYKGEALRKMEADAEVNKRVLSLKINDVTTAAYSGKPIPQDKVSAISSQLNQLKGEEAAYLKDNLNLALQYNAKLQEAKSLPIDKLQNTSEFVIDHGDDVFNFSNRVAARKQFEEGMKNIINDRINNAPKFHFEEDEDVRLASKSALDLKDPGAMDSWATLIEGKQKADGLTSVKYLTPEMSKTYGSMLKSKNIDTANLVRDTLANGYGEERFNKIVSEMVLNKDIEPEQAMAFYLPDPGARKLYLENISKKKDLSKDFESQPKEIQSGLKELYASPEVMTLQKSILAADKDLVWLTNSMREGLKVNYQSFIANGMDPDDAKERTLDMVARNYGVAATGKSSVVLPKTFEPYRSAVEDYMDDSLKLHNLKLMNISPDPAYSNDPKLIGSDVEAKYLEDVSKFGAWVSNASQTGVILTKLNPDGSRAPVRDKLGNKIERSFTDMRNGGLLYNEEIGSYISEINSLKEEAKTSVAAAGRIKILRDKIAELKKEESQRKQVRTF